MANLLPLVGLAVLAIGFAARVNPVLAVGVAALVTGLASGHGVVGTLEALGKAFNADRYVSLAWLILPVIGLLERYGLQARARFWIERVRTRSVGRLLLVYLALRQVTSALGLVALGGPAAMVRPLIAPMAESAAAADAGPLPPRTAARVRAHAAAVDTIGVFFGEDVFIAVGSILLIRATLHGAGVDVEPLRLSLWAIPTAVGAFLIHGLRLLRLDAAVRRDARAARGPEGAS